MYKTITALVISIAALVSAHGYLAQKYAAENPRHSEPVSMVNRDGVTAEDIEAIGIVLPGADLELVYTKKENAWRLAAYRDAYAQSDRIEGVIKDIVETSGVPANRRGRGDSFYGINENSLRIKLYAVSEIPVADVICGRQLPGLWGRDSYIKMTGREEIYHINGNPMSSIGVPGGLPPLVDPKLIPSALGSLGEPARVTFEPPGVMPFSSIERRVRTATEEELKSMPPAMREQKQYDWFAVSGEEEIKLNERSAGSYINFIRSMTYKRIPRTEEIPGGGGPTEKRLIIFFESQSRAEGGENAPPERRIEYIDIKGPDSQGNRLLWFSGTGFTASVDSRKAALLFPDMEILVNPAQSPSIFDRAESGGAPPAPM